MEIASNYPTLRTPPEPPGHHHLRILIRDPPCTTAKRLLGVEDPEELLKEVDGYYKILNATRAVNLSVADEGGSVRPGALADFIKNNPSSPTGAPNGAPTPAPTPTGHAAGLAGAMKHAMNAGVGISSGVPDGFDSLSDSPTTAEELFQSFMQGPDSPSGMTMSSAGGEMESEGDGLGVEASTDEHDFDGQLDHDGRGRYQTASDWVASALPPSPPAPALRE